MSLKSMIITVMAALAVFVGVGAAGVLSANAATPASTGCGSSCTDLFSPAFGTATPPAFVLDVRNQAAPVGAPVIVARASGTNPGEDFTMSIQGTVGELVAAGLMSPGLDALYSNLNVAEIEYAPSGFSAGLCIGVGATPGFGTPVTLQSCGVSARTFWIFDPETRGTGSYDALISGATNSNFQHPYSLTTPLPGLPLFTTPLEPNFPAPVFAHQLWGQFPGALP
jgi:hypothetical protein